MAASPVHSAQLYSQSGDIDQLLDDVLVAPSMQAASSSSRGGEESHHHRRQRQRRGKSQRQEESSQSAAAAAAWASSRDSQEPIGDALSAKPRQQAGSQSEAASSKRERELMEKLAETQRQLEELGRLRNGAAGDAGGQKPEDSTEQLYVNTEELRPPVPPPRTSAPNNAAGGRLAVAASANHSSGSHAAHSSSSCSSQQQQQQQHHHHHHEQHAHHAHEHHEQHHHQSSCSQSRVKETASKKEESLEVEESVSVFQVYPPPGGLPPPQQQQQQPQQQQLLPQPDSPSPLSEEPLHSFPVSPGGFGDSPMPHRQQPDPQQRQHQQQHREEHHFHQHEQHHHNQHHNQHQHQQQHQQQQQHRYSQQHRAAPVLVHEQQLQQQHHRQPQQPQQQQQQHYTQETRLRYSSSSGGAQQQQQQQRQQRQQQQRQQQQLASVSAMSSAAAARIRAGGGGGGGARDLVSPMPSSMHRFVSDTSSVWYRPSASREEAVAALQPLAAGRFVVRDSHSFPGAYGLAVKAPHASDEAPDSVRHFLIEQSSNGVRIRGCANEPVFASLSALIYQHTVSQLALPCRLLLPEMPTEPAPVSPASSSMDPVAILDQGAACNVLYLGSVDIEALTGDNGVAKAVDMLLRHSESLRTTECQLKVARDGISLTDTRRRQFFRKHYPTACVSYCGMDPIGRHFDCEEVRSRRLPSSKIFGFIARKNPTSRDNTGVVVCEIEEHQPAEAVVRFVDKYLIGRR